ncbi:hypothetical protein ABW20_dc0100926 [Dactylellina cionopaga]|nr:hypothetical protein ABW20_dc0100926 [Dactylellina cionopaga]
MDESANILSIAKLCKEAFADCVSTIAIGEQAWIRSAQGDFNLWCASIKATSSNKSSLDYRLREKLDLREDIYSGEEPQPADSRPDSPLSIGSWEAMSNESDTPYSFSGDEASDPILSENISYVKMILSQLARISLAIRKSGNKYRFEKADAYFDDEHFEGFRKYLTTIILMGFEDQEAEKLTTAEKMHRALDYDRLTQVQKRMIHVNILRRGRIEFVTRFRTPITHHKAASQQPPKLVARATASELLDTNPKPGPPQPTPSRITYTSSHLAPGGSRRSEAFTTAVTATEVDSKLDIKGILSKKTQSVATKMTRIGASQAYPRCPGPRPDGSLICPYCDDLLPSDFSGSKREDRWR